MRITSTRGRWPAGSAPRGRQVWISLALLLAASAWIPKPAQTEFPGSLRITWIDLASFPDVRVQFVARDPSGRPMEELDKASLRVTEDGREAAIESLQRTECGVRVVFVIDVGDGALNTGVHLSEVYRLAQRHVAEFVAGRPWMVDGVDEIEILVQEGDATREVIAFSSSGESVDASLSAFTLAGDNAFSRTDTYGKWSREALSEALDAIEYSPDESGKAAQVVLFTPGARADLADVAQRALMLDVPIHVHLSRLTTTHYWEEALTPLAQATHGRFSTELEDDDLADLFHELTRSRQQFLLTYRSSSAERGTRTVVLQSTGSTVSAQATATYEVVPEAPGIELRPESTSIVRRGGRGPQGWVGEPSFVTIPFEVDWPDGSPRQIVLAQLLADDIPVSVGEITGQRGSFTWDIREYTSWSSTPVILRGEIRDELGLRAVSPAVTISIGYRPSGILSGAAGWLTYSAAALSVAALAASGALFVYRRRWGPVVHDAGERVIDFIERVTGRRAAPVVRAKLVPVQGFEPPLPPAFDLYGTTAIGRSRRHADLLFHLEDETSPISRLHCTVLDEDDHFRLRDEASSNGTFLNGERLPELDPRDLNDGDLIDLAPLERGGLRVRFHVVPDGAAETRALDDLGLTRPRAAPGSRVPEIDAAAAVDAGDPPNNGETGG